MSLKTIFATLALLCIYAVAQAETATTLTVGTNAEFAPFSFRDGGEIVGFDIDIAKEVGKRLNKEIKFKDMPFDALIPDVVMGHVDFVAAGMTYTEERAKRVAFTKPYLNQDALVILTVVRSGSNPLNDLQALQGKKVVVNEGFTADLFLSSKEGIKLVRLPTTADAFLALNSGRADAFVTAKSTVDMFMATQDASKFIWTPIEGSADNCALVVSKKYPKLLVDIQQALDDMEKDGTITHLKAKWKFS